MSDKVKSQFRHPLVQDARWLIAEYEFSLGQITTVISLRLYQSLADDSIWVEQSHFIQTPIHSEPAFNEHECHPDPETAVERILSEFVRHYEDAEKMGHAPSADWLLPSRDFC